MPTRSVTKRVAATQSADPQFRAACHAALDIVLDTNPRTQAIMIGFEAARGKVGMVTYPPGDSVKRGFLAALASMWDLVKPGGGSSS